MAWLAEQHVPLVRLDWQGHVTDIMGGAYGTNSRRVDEQIAAQRPARAIPIAAGLIHKKVVNNIETLRHAIPISEGQSHTIAKLRNEADQLCETASKIRWRLLGAEGRVAYPPSVIEAALAHAKGKDKSQGHDKGNATTQAYLRSDFFEARRKLMEAWNEFATGIAVSLACLDKSGSLLGRRGHQ